METLTDLSFAGCLIPTGDNLPNGKVRVASSLVETTSSSMYKLTWQNYYETWQPVDAGASRTANLAGLLS